MWASRPLSVVQMKPPSAVGGGSLLLDLVSGATAGFSTRKIRTAYAGPCLKVRRSSDDTAQDIGFIGNALDTTALTAFVGANFGYINTWYDQSGNGQHALQATLDIQPRIATTGGALETLNGNPAVNWSGSIAAGAYLGLIPVLSLVSASAWTVLCGHTSLTYGIGVNFDQTRPIFGDINGYVGMGYDATSLTAGFFDTTYRNASAVASLPVTAVGVGRYDGTTLGSFLNGGAGGTLSYSGAIGNTTGNIRIALIVGVSTLDGKMTELIFYNTGRSNANCNTLGASMATYCGATWSNM